MTRGRSDGTRGWGTWHVRLSDDTRLSDSNDVCGASGGWSRHSKVSVSVYRSFIQQNLVNKLHVVYVGGYL